MPPLPGSKEKTQLFKTLKEHVGNVEHHERPNSRIIDIQEESQVSGIDNRSSEGS